MKLGATVRCFIQTWLLSAANTTSGSLSGLTMTARISSGSEWKDSPQTVRNGCGLVVERCPHFSGPRVSPTTDQMKTTA